jgi:hypothetical protein
MPNDWSTAALNNAISNGLLNGSNGEILPGSYLTRAEMATVINRAFGATEMASIGDYADVAADAWYYAEMAKAVHMGTFLGTGNNLNPGSNITRQEVFVVLARAFKLSGGGTAALDRFSDRGSVDSWAKDAACALVEAGYINGSNGELKPLSCITRAEFAQVMDNLLKCYLNKEGTYTDVPAGNVMINAPKVTLRNVSVKGDLVIGDGVGDGDVTLDNVAVAGRTVIRGGGANSIRITGTSNLQNIIVARVDGVVRVYAEDGTDIGEVLVDGKDDVTLEGDFGTVLLAASDVTVTATSAQIASATITGEDSKIVVASNATIDALRVDAPNATVDVLGRVQSIVVDGDGATVSCTGRVVSVAANADNLTVSTANTDVTAASGTTGVIAGSRDVPDGNTVNTSYTEDEDDYAPPTVPTPTIASVNPNAGPIAGGTTVTIAGTNFTGASAVTFGGTAATSFAVDSATQITAETPAGVAGAVDVVVTTAGGSATSAGAYTYAAAPTIASVNPNAGPEAGGTTVIVTGTSFTGASAVTLGGTAATSFTVDSATQITAVTPAKAAGAVDVVVTTPGGSATDAGAYTYTPAPTIPRLTRT